MAQNPYTHHSNASSHNLNMMQPPSYSPFPNTTPQPTNMAQNAPMMHDFTLSELPPRPPKRNLNGWSMAPVKDEWRNGSKMRVIRFYFGSIMIGLCLGVMIAMVVIVVVRKTREHEDGHRD
jgi:hypothetical protein